jgi:23S rRNA (uracil1939-C5)-methyltransferase
VDVLDLYAGGGLFALPLARRGHRVLGVEENPAAVEAGRRSQRLNGLDGRTCRIVRARVETLRATRAQAVVLDPPRRGCAERVLHAIAREVRPDVVVYVSCDPDSLARDLDAWFRAVPRGAPSYRIYSVQPLDMFPHTPHLETVVTIRRDAGDTPGRAGRGRSR